LLRALPDRLVAADFVGKPVGLCDTTLLNDVQFAATGRENSVTLDVITIGRSSVALYGVQVGGRLEDMVSFNK